MTLRMLVGKMLKMLQLVWSVASLFVEEWTLTQSLQLRVSVFKFLVGPAPEPKSPALDIVARHNLTHLSYAPWCPHCVAARRANNPHFRREESHRRMIPLLVFDYCFVRNTQDEDLLNLLVGRLYPTRTVFACPVDMKGRDPVAIAMLDDFIKKERSHLICL